MPKKTHKLSIRLLKEDLAPEDALRKERIEEREDSILENWERIEGAKIFLGNFGTRRPKWMQFLEFSPDARPEITNRSSAGLVFIFSRKRWFAVSFGLGHVKIDPSKIEHDFGLKVVLNSIDHEHIRSADIRTPNEYALIRRSQVSRGVKQDAFSINLESDIVKGVAGKPRKKSFATKIAGTDSLTIYKQMTLDDLTSVCSQCLDAYKSKKYKKHFKWIDQIQHIRDTSLIKILKNNLVDALNDAIESEGPEEHGLCLAYPTIYDPEAANKIKYKGFRSSETYDGLAIEEYIKDLKDRGMSNYIEEYLERHTAHEVDDHGKDCGKSWKIIQCLFYETDIYNDRDLADGKYMLLDGDWYKIDTKFSDKLNNFFSNHCDDNFPLPYVDEGDKEEAYNKSIKEDKSNQNLLCIHGKLIKPNDAETPFEPCDLIDRMGNLIHVKYGNSSSALSHLFAQGANSAETLLYDDFSRKEFIRIIGKQEEQSKSESQCTKSGFKEKICLNREDYNPSDITVVFAVIPSARKPRIPFFSLVTFYRSGKDILKLGYKLKFCWIKRNEDAKDIGEQEK